MTAGARCIGPAAVAVRGLALVAALAAAACGGAGQLATTPAGDAVARTGAVGAGSGGAEQTARFDPFSERTETASPLRAVIANPSPAEVMKTGPLSEMAIGRADAPVTIIKYMSLTCPYCRQFHLTVFPQLKREYIDTGKVRFVLREFPIGFQSGMATIALRCVPAEKYFDLYGRFLAQQARWVSQEVRKDPIFEVAKGVGLTRAAFDACTQNRALVEGLKWMKDRGRTLGVIGTPNFFVDGRLVKSVLTMAEIRAMVDPLVAARSAGGRMAGAQRR
ncbi:MAG: DsbA family protein [Hyphomicrobiaceae bacterium]